jgi:hypothetical protein
MKLGIAFFGIKKPAAIAIDENTDENASPACDYALRSALPSEERRQRQRERGETS